jgi:hypothetical protein
LEAAVFLCLSLFVGYVLKVRLMLIVRRKCLKIVSKKGDTTRHLKIGFSHPSYLPRTSQTKIFKLQFFGFDALEGYPLSAAWRLEGTLRLI